MDLRRLLPTSLFAAVATASAALAAPVSIPELKAYMKATVDPAANAVFAAGNDAPEGETAAAAAKRWAAAVEGARTLKQASTRLAKPDWMQPGDWAKFNALMADAATKVEVAAKTRDAEAAMAAGGDLYDGCNGCHHIYEAGH